MRLKRYLLSKVKGSAQRKILENLFEQGRYAGLNDMINEFDNLQANSKSLESVHPMYMGGNYLPDIEDDEVEIARVTTKSTTSDVTSVYARRDGDRIHYRVVDEYGGETLEGPAELTTAEPMTLREFADFFLTAWISLPALKAYFENDLDEALDFFSINSEFYKELEIYCQQQVVEIFRECQPEHE
jgi:hypothetical protein